MEQPRFSALQPARTVDHGCAGRRVQPAVAAAGDSADHLLLLLHMALQHRRHIEILGLLAPLLLAPALARQLEDRPGGSRTLQGVDRAIAELKKPATGLGIALSLVLFVVLTAAVLPRQRLHMADDLTPAAALASVGAHQ
jgi:hypothetical protein